MAKTRKKSSKKAKYLRIDEIRIDGDTQPRAELDQAVIIEYAEAMKAGVEFPPLDVFFDGVSYWLVDGFHRRWAAGKSDVERLACTVHEGSLEDARWFSFARNTDHGLRRNNADKRKAVEQALRHPSGAEMSDGSLAEHCGVSSMTVAKYRREIESTIKDLELQKRKGKDGRARDTSNIGKKRKQKSKPVEESDGESGEGLTGGMPLDREKLREASADTCENDCVDCNVDCDERGEVYEPPGEAKTVAVSEPEATEAGTQQSWRDYLSDAVRDVLEDEAGLEPYVVAAHLDLIAGELRATGE